jgi:hypothetical protein
LRRLPLRLRGGVFIAQCSILLTHQHQEDANKKMKQTGMQEEAEEYFVYEALGRKPRRENNIFRPTVLQHHQIGGSISLKSRSLWTI